MLLLFFDYGDEILERYQADNEWFGVHDLDTYSVADRLIRWIVQEDEEKTMAFLTEQASLGRAWYWIAKYVRHLLMEHGMAGQRPRPQLEKWLEWEGLYPLRDALAERLNSPAITGTLAEFPRMNEYIWAWRDISEEEIVQEWANNLTAGDEAFLNLLLQLHCHHGNSSVDGCYRALKLSNLTPFLRDVDDIHRRIDRIRKAVRFPELVSEVKKSIQETDFEPGFIPLSLSQKPHLGLFAYAAN